MEILLFLISDKKKRTLKSRGLFDTFEDIAHAISAFDLAWGERLLKCQQQVWTLDEIDLNLDMSVSYNGEVKNRIKHNFMQIST